MDWTPLSTDGEGHGGLPRPSAPREGPNKESPLVPSVSVPCCTSMSWVFYAAASLENLRRVPVSAPRKEKPRRTHSTTRTDAKRRPYRQRRCRRCETHMYSRAVRPWNIPSGRVVRELNAKLLLFSGVEGSRRRKRNHISQSRASRTTPTGDGASKQSTLLLGPCRITA